jgi:hypothetical protein
MRRVTTALLALVVVVAVFPVTGTVGVGGGAAAQSESSIAPGQQFAGVVGVQGAEVRNEIEDRTLAARLGAADANATRAAVVARESVRIDARLDTLEERRADLRDRREDGEVTSGTYSAELAEVTAEATALERRAGTLLTTARSLPNATLADAGVSVADLTTLRDRADALTDAEALSAARAVAGDDVGEDLDDEAEESDAEDGDGSEDGEGSEDGDGESSEDGDGDSTETASDTSTETESDSDAETESGSDTSTETESGTTTETESDTTTETSDGSDSTDGEDGTDSESG